MSMTQTRTPGSPAPDRPAAMTGAWQLLAVGQRDGWVPVARALVEGEPDYYWCGDAGLGDFVDGLERPRLGTGEPMAATVAVYPTSGAVITAWQCHLNSLHAVGSAPPRYRIEPYRLASIHNRDAVPARHLLPAGTWR